MTEGDVFPQDRGPAAAAAIKPTANKAAIAAMKPARILIRDCTTPTIRPAAMAEQATRIVGAALKACDELQIEMDVTQRAVR